MRKKVPHNKETQLEAGDAPPGVEGRGLTMPSLAWKGVGSLLATGLKNKQDRGEEKRAQLRPSKEKIDLCYDYV